MKRKTISLISAILALILLISAPASAASVRYEADFTTSYGFEEQAALTFGYDDMGFLQVLLDTSSLGEWIFETDGTEFAFGAVDGNVYSVNKDSLLKITASAFAVSAFGMTEDRAETLAAYMTDGDLYADAESVYAILAGEANRIFASAAEKGIVKIHENGDLEIKTTFSEALDALLSYIRMLSEDDSVLSAIASMKVFGALDIPGEDVIQKIRDSLSQAEADFAETAEILKASESVDFHLFVSASGQEGYLDISGKSTLSEMPAEYRYTGTFTAASLSFEEYLNASGLTISSKTVINEDGYKRVVSEIYTDPLEYGVEMNNSSELEISRNGFSWAGSYASDYGNAEWAADINKESIVGRIDCDFADENGINHTINGKADILFETGDTDIALYAEKDGHTLCDMHVLRKGAYLDSAFIAYDGENQVASIRIAGENEYAIEGFIKEAFYKTGDQTEEGMDAFRSFFKKDEKQISFEAKALLTDGGFALSGTAERIGYVKNDESWIYSFTKDSSADDFIVGHIDYTAGKRQDKADIKISSIENGAHAEYAIVSIDGKDEVSLDAKADFTKDGLAASWTISEDELSASRSLLIAKDRAELFWSDGVYDTAVQMQYDLSGDVQKLSGALSMTDPANEDRMMELLTFDASYDTLTGAYEFYLSSPYGISYYYSFDGSEYIMQMETGYEYYDLKGRRITDETGNYMEWTGTVNGDECIMRSGWKYENEYTRIYFEETIIDGQKENFEVRLVASDDELGITVSGSAFLINLLPASVGAGIRLVDENHLFASAFAEIGQDAYAISLPVEYELTENLLKNLIAKLIYTENSEETTLAELTVNGEILDKTLPHIPATPITGSMLAEAVRTLSGEIK